MNRRIHYIDNLRWITVSLLILFHTAIAYNTWDEANYIFFKPVKVIAAIVSFINPWFMPLMFLLAGVSSRFSLQKRGYKTFIKERFVRLGIPLIFGILFINPILSYVADLTHNGYKGSFFRHYEVFFTKFTDLTGYDGGFTLGHFWFLAVLIVVSILSCAVIRIAEGAHGVSNNTADEGERGGGKQLSTSENNRKNSPGTGKYSGIENSRVDNKPRSNGIKAAGIILAVLAVATFDIKVSGKPVYTFLALYLLGYFIFSDESFVKRLSGLKWVYAATFLIVSVANVALFIFIGKYETLNTVCNYLAFIFGITTLISIGHDHLDRSNKVTAFNARLSYVFYIAHFPVVVLCQYFLGRAGVGGELNYILTIVITYPVVYGLCYLIDKTRYIRVLFGLKIKQ